VEAMAGREERLAQHKTQSDELRQLKADLRQVEKQMDALAAQARAQIRPDEARRLILARLHAALHDD